MLAMFFSENHGRVETEPGSAAEITYLFWLPQTQLEIIP